MRASTIHRFVFLFALTAVHAHAGDVHLDVTRGGDLRWQGACSAQAFAVGADKIVTFVDDIHDPLTLDDGKYDVVVSCAAREGVVRKTVSVQVPKDVTVPVPLNPGEVIVRVQRDGKDVPAAVAVVDDHGREVARGRDRVVLVAPAGKVHIVATVDAEAAHANHPVLGTLPAVVAADARAELFVDTTDGELLLTLTDNGKPAEGVVGLRAPGQRTRLLEVKANAPTAVPPGEYDIVTTLDSAHDVVEVLTRDVKIAPRTRTTRTVDHKTGRIAVDVHVDDAAPKGTTYDDAKVEVALSLAGAPAPFNTLASTDEAHVAPGRYHVRATRSDVTLDDGTVPTADVDVTVTAGHTSPATLDLTPAHVLVKTRVNGKPAALVVEVRAKGGETPLGTAHTDDTGEHTLLLPAGRVVLVAHLDGDDTLRERAEVVLKHGAQPPITLSLDFATVLVQVLEAGVAVPADVELVVEQKGQHYAVAAGAELKVPPGVYTLVVTRKNVRKAFGVVKVAAGGTLERKLEW
jgi:hypothetical protein